MADALGSPIPPGWCHCVYSSHSNKFTSVQEDLLKICITDIHYTGSHGAVAGDAAATNGTAAAPGSAVAAPAAAVADVATTAHRLLLATSSTENPCPEGEVSIWKSVPCVPL